MNTKQVYRIFEDFNKLKAIVIGDVMLDTYMWGKVERISPEAPIPIVSVAKRENRLGGAANVLLNLKALGAAPYLLSVIGNDEPGKILLTLLKEKNLQVSGIFTDSTRNTTVKNRIISKGQHIARVDEESTDFIDREIENKIFDSFHNLVDREKIDVIVFVDYDKGVITPSLFERINEVAIKKEIPVTVDPKKRNFHMYRNISLFKPNFSEFTEGTGIPISKGNMDLLAKEADELKMKQNFDYIFITLSELGVFLSNGIKKQYFPAVVRDIADVSGAGDTVISVSSLAIASGLHPNIMALMANLAGGLVCEKTGVVPIDKEQLIKEMLLSDF